jgi:hypothetical protein
MASSSLAVSSDDTKKEAAAINSIRTTSNPSGSYLKGRSMPVVIFVLKYTPVRWL